MSYQAHWGRKHHLIAENTPQSPNPNRGVLLETLHLATRKLSGIASSPPQNTVRVDANVNETSGTDGVPIFLNANHLQLASDMHIYI